MKAKYKYNPSEESQLFNVVFQDGKQEFDYPWHYHPECELIYISKGHGLRYLGNSVESYFNNDLVMVGSNLPHCWLNESNYDDQSSNAIVIYLKEDFFAGSWLQSHEFTEIRKMFELSGNGIKFDPLVASELKSKFVRLPNLPPLQKFILLIEILSELSVSSGYHLLCDQKYSCDFDQSYRERFNTIFKYVMEHYSERISLEAIAEQVYMSPAYFSKFFSKCMQKSFFEFLNEYRINRTCKSLIETDKSITEICYNAGFNSIPFFYRQFKKFKHCQPKQYRQTYLKASFQKIDF